MVVAKTQEDLDEGINMMLALAGEARGAKFKVTHTSTRPLWRPNPKTAPLFEQVKTIAQGLGLDFQHSVGGGGSDGNITGAAGVATLDGLGLRGDGNHTLNEYIEVTTLAERAELFRAILVRLQ